MSVYGGDSWAREAHHRKRRVDDLMMDGLDSSTFKKLSNGKFTCLLCPNHPLLDSSLMLSTHKKGARHCAALSKHKEKELKKQEAINKRIALSDNDVTTSASPSACSQNQRPRFPSKPLIEQTRKLTNEVLHYENSCVRMSAAFVCHDRDAHQQRVSVHDTSRNNDDAVTVPTQHYPDFRERWEKELKFTAAGWKRDCHGKWYRDENVEFDSDEEDPNICLT